MGKKKKEGKDFGESLFFYPRQTSGLDLIFVELWVTTDYRDTRAFYSLAQNGGQLWHVVAKVQTLFWGCINFFFPSHYCGMVRKRYLKFVV